MDVGLLNRRIIVQKKVTERDDAGISTSSWKDDFSLWSTISNESGQVDSGEGLNKSAVDISFTVRYCRQSLSVAPLTHRILFGGEFFDIVSVDHVSYKGSMIKFNCQKVRSSNVR